MEYRHHIDSTPELAAWYDNKYTEMGDGWNTPAEESNKHLDDLGVPFDMSLELLDVGCGAGHFLAEAEKRVIVSGFEVSEVGLEFARKRCDVAAFFQHSVEMPFGGEYDYIVSLGSLEHIVDLDAALDNIRALLKPTGKFYFYCPNEQWKHFDQPNERTMTDDEWIALFASHGLYVHTKKRWNDNTAFVGTGAAPGSVVELPPRGNKLNIGSGQRRFDAGHGWVNIDRVSRPPDQVPDLVLDAGIAPLPYDNIDHCVLHQVYEHFGLGEGHGLIRECHRVLKPGGSLILTVPNMRALASRWMTHQLDDYLYYVNVYGAYQGEEQDRHRWGYTFDSLVNDLYKAAPWHSIVAFNFRQIPGADFAQDWWILGVECIR